MVRRHMGMASWCVRRAAVFVLLACGCGDVSGYGGPVDVQGPEPLLQGEAQRERLCARGNQDVVTDLFCKDRPPSIGGLMDLRNALGLGAEVDEPNGGFAITGHSTSLVHRSVSAINPRIIFIHNESKTRDVTAMAFARGEQFSEIVVRDRSVAGLQFYLAIFTLACNDAVEGCGPGDLLTGEVEVGWTGLDVYGEEDLKNTPLDCRACHQPGGPSTPKMLRMQELEAPWNHWFYRLSEGGRALLRDYQAAKGNESFAGLPLGNVGDAQPGMLSFALLNV